MGNLSEWFIFDSDGADARPDSSLMLASLYEFCMEDKAGISSEQRNIIQRCSDYSTPPINRLIGRVNKSRNPPTPQVTRTT